MFAIININVGIFIATPPVHLHGMVLGEA